MFQVIKPYFLRKIKVKKLKWHLLHFYLAWTKYRKSYYTTPGVGVGVGGGGGVSKMLKFIRESFYLMGKALSGELSCPCDRSCLFGALRVKIANSVGIPFR